MLVVPFAPEFGWRLHSHAGRPTTNWGVSVTPGNNTKGSYAQVISGASVANDVWGIEIWINSNALSAAARDLIVDIGTDPAGGTSYTVTIADLLGTVAGNMTGGVAPIRYYFPLFIPAGSSIGARASVNNATVGTCFVAVILYGKPKYPDLTRAGSSVQTLGANAAASNGTTITSGGASEGSWTSLGTLTRAAWWWQVGFGVNDTTLQTQTYSLDLSAGSAGGQKMLIEDALVINTSSETGTLWHPQPCVRQAAAGDNVYGRMQASGTADSALSMIAYALA